MGCGSSTASHPTAGLHRQTQANCQLEIDSPKIPVEGCGPAELLAWTAINAGDDRAAAVTIGTAPEQDHIVAFLPYLPRRIPTRHWLRRDAVAPVSRIRGALLMIDISGFTHLSAAYGRLGTAGCERFSLLVGDLFDHLTGLLEDNGGDIDCFAGDAVLVLFSASTADGDSAAPEIADEGIRISTALGEAVSRALRCAQVVARQLSGFQTAQDDPPLHVHFALTAGEMFSAICSGQLTSRSEAFLVGSPVTELGGALALSQASEAAIAPSAWKHLGNAELPPGEERQGGHLCISLAADGAGGGARMQNGAFSSPKSLSFVTARAPSPSLVAFFSETFGDNSTGPVAGQGQLAAPYAADVFRFVPAFVKGRLHAGVCSREHMSEHRQVSVLFVTGKIEDQSHQTSVEWVGKLSAQLGKVMDVAEVECGATTRQITVDDKGVTAIFVFGLPGLLSGVSHLLACAAAADPILSSLECEGVSFAAGLGTGPAFCGIVGDTARRCEYTVMGDAVNTAARLAGFAHKRGLKVACSGNFVRLLAACPGATRVEFRSAGSTRLKGKETDVQVFGVYPAVLKAGRRADNGSGIVQLCGRHGDLEAVSALLAKGAQGGAGLLLLDGLAGSGKSQLLRTIAAQVGTPEMPGHPLWPWHAAVLELRLSSANGPMFHVCHCLLEWLLRTRHPELPDKMARKLSNLENLAALGTKCLPEIIRPFLHQLQRLRDGRAGTNRLSGLQQLYFDILQVELRRQPLLLLVDDFHHADAASCGVLRRLFSDRAPSSSQTPRDEQQPRYPILSICTMDSSALGLATESSGSARRQLWDGLRCETAVFTHNIAPLGRAAVLEIARRELGCAQLTEELATLVTDYSHGLPLYAREISQWLQDQGHLEVVMLDKQLTAITGLRAGARQSLAAHPSLLSIVTSRLDQLPVGLVNTLRCASCIGLAFDAPLLLKLIRTQGDKEINSTSLLKQLWMLQALRFVTRAVVDEEASPELDVWQFCQVMQHEAVYSAMLHRTRGELHRRLESILRAQIACRAALLPPQSHVVSYEHSELWALREQLAEQHVMRGAVGASGMSVPELKLATDTLGELMDHSMVFCSALKAIEYLDRALELADLIAAQPKAQVEQKLLHGIRFGIVQRGLNLMGNVDIFGSLALVPDSERAHRIKKLQALFDELSIMQAGGSDMEVGTSKTRERGISINRSLSMRSLAAPRKHASPGSNHVGKQLLVTAKMTPLLLEFNKSQSMLKDSSLRKALTMLDSEATVIGKLIVVPYACVFTAALGRYHAAIAQLSKAYRPYREACRPAELRRLKTLVGVFAVPSISGYLSTFNNIVGNVDSPGNLLDLSLDISWLASAEEHFGIRIQCLCMISVEWQWEPAGSIRMAPWADVVAGKELNSSKQEKNSMFTPAMNIAAESVSLGVASANLARDLVSGTTKIGMQADVESLGLEMTIYTATVLGSSIKVWIWGAVRLLVTCGCGMIWPQLGNASTPLQAASTPLTQSPELAASHLSTVAKCLGDLLQWWEAHRININGASTFPAALTWAKAMLHWFQWLLWVSHATPGSPPAADAARLRQGVCGWGRGPSVSPGPPAVSRALLLAQAMSCGPSDTEQSELMVARLPATVSLAMMLAGCGQQNSAQLPSREKQKDDCAARLLVPHGATHGLAAEEVVSAERVDIGSLRALEVGRGHLAAVLAAVRVGGKPVDLEAAGASDVGCSETLWQAVALYQALVQQLATSSPESAA